MLLVDLPIFVWLTNFFFFDMSWHIISLSNIFLSLGDCQAQPYPCLKGGGVPCVYIYIDKTIVSYSLQKDYKIHMYNYILYILYFVSYNCISKTLQIAFSSSWLLLW